MSDRTRRLCWIILGQAACVAAGLWMQFNLLSFSTYQTVEEQMRSDIELTATGLLRDLEAQQPDALAHGGQTVERLQAVCEQAPLRDCQATVVDRDWHPLVYRHAAEQGRPGRSPRGQPISWTPLPGQTAGPAELVRGTLKTDDGPQLAVAYALPNGAGHLLVHRPVADIKARVAPLRGPLLAIGGVTFLWTVALLSVAVYVMLIRHHQKLDRERARSTSDILRQTRSLIRTRDAVIFALARLADFRDGETGSHLERISTYSSLLASTARAHPKFAGQITPTFVRLIGFSSLLHDVGKVGIEDRVLRKPGRLTERERQQMQQHTIMAGACLGEIARQLDSSDFLDMAGEIAVAHHEHWNGGGYPYGLKGDAIPLAARIVAIADVYDALSTRRVYKLALPHEQCVAIIRESAGKQFDPDLVEVWLTVEAKFREICARYAAAPNAAEPSRFRPLPWGSEEAKPDQPAGCSPAPVVAKREASTNSLAAS